MLRKILIFLVVSAIIKTTGQFLLDSHREKTVYRSLQDAIEKMNKTLPLQVADGRLQLDSVELSDHVVRFTGQQIWREELNDQEKEELAQNVKALYCGPKGKLFLDAKVSVEYHFTTQLHSLNNLKPEIWNLSYGPDKCA
jgi:hypothetical protein